MRCIYCSADVRPPFHDAHVIPEALVGDGPKLESGEVCLRCNNDIANLEKRFIHDLDLFSTVFGPITNKRGRLRRLTKRGFHGYRDETGLNVFVNSSTKRTTARDGTTVNFAPEAERWALEATDIGNGRVAISGTRELRVSSKFRRFLTKVAFEAVCFQHGRSACLHPAFDSVRQFIRYGRGQRYVVLGRRGSVPFGADGKALLALFRTRHDDLGYSCIVKIGPIDAFVDLTETHAVLERAYRERASSIDEHFALYPEQPVFAVERRGA